MLKEQTGCEGKDWIRLAQDAVQLRTLMNAVNRPSSYINSGNVWPVE